MNLRKSHSCYPTGQLVSGSQFDHTDPDYEDRHLQRMRVEYCSLSRMALS